MKLMKQFETDRLSNAIDEWRMTVQLSPRPVITIIATSNDILFAAYYSYLFFFFWTNDHLVHQSFRRGQSHRLFLLLFYFLFTADSFNWVFQWHLNWNPLLVRIYWFHWFVFTSLPFQLMACKKFLIFFCCCCCCSAIRFFVCMSRLDSKWFRWWQKVLTRLEMFWVHESFVFERGMEFRVTINNVGTQ